MLNWTICFQQGLDCKKKINLSHHHYLSFSFSGAFLYLLRRVIINLNCLDIGGLDCCAKTGLHACQGFQHGKAIKISENDSYLFPNSIHHLAWLEKNTRPCKDCCWAGPRQRLKMRGLNYAVHQKSCSRHSLIFLPKKVEIFSHKYEYAPFLSTWRWRYYRDGWV